MSSSSVHWRDVSGGEGTDRDAVTDGGIEVVRRECIPSAGEVKREKNEAGNCKVGVEGVGRGRGVGVEGVGQGRAVDVKGGGGVLVGVEYRACVGEVDEGRTMFGEW